MHRIWWIKNSNLNPIPRCTKQLVHFFGFEDKNYLILCNNNFFLQKTLFWIYFVCICNIKYKQKLILLSPNPWFFHKSVRIFFMPFWEISQISNQHACTMHMCFLLTAKYCSLHVVTRISVNDIFALSFSFGNNGESKHYPHISTFHIIFILHDKSKSIKIFNSFAMDSYILRLIPQQPTAFSIHFPCALSLGVSHTIGFSKNDRTKVMEKYFWNSSAFVNLMPKMLAHNCAMLLCLLGTAIHFVKLLNIWYWLQMMKENTTHIIFTSLSIQSFFQNITGHFRGKIWRNLQKYVAPNFLNLRKNANIKML